MEASAGRSGPLPVTSSHAPMRKEWRVISENSFRKNGGEESENLHKSEQTDERTIYEEGAEPVNIDLCSIVINGEGLKEESLLSRLQEISRQRKDLQHVEIELRAQVVARSEILDMHNRYQSQFKEHVDAAAKLKEQLQEREQEIHELELNVEEKNRELHAVKIDNEAVWAKEDLYREQNNELATFRRERDNSEAERAKLLKKVHDLQEHIQEKESQFRALEEQNRVAQETILYKDEQLREMQAWISRAQEVDALQSTTNRSLQAELRERIEQFNQYWIALQQQFVDMERHHLQTIHQLHLELAEIRGKSGVYQDSPHIVRENQTESPLYLENKGSQVSANDGTVLNNSLTFGTDGKFPTSSSTNAEQVPPVHPLLFGMGAFAPVGQMTALHPFVMHQQGVLESVSPTNPVVPQSHVEQMQSACVMPAQHWQKQLALQEISEPPSEDKYHLSQLNRSLLGSHYHYSQGLSISFSENELHPEHLRSHIDQQQRPTAETFESNKIKAIESTDKTYQVSQEMHVTPNANSNLNALYFEPTEQKIDNKVSDQSAESAINGTHQQVFNMGQQWSVSSANTSASSHCVAVNSSEDCNEAKQVSPAVSIPVIGLSNSISANTTKEPVLLDERALLACIVRAIPAGSDGRIRISTTLPNRLGKMLAPLHWYDYKKYYGKLDDFVARHPELFVIEGDYIHLCEGAQEIISATAAVAKVAAATASSAPYSSLFPSVAVTPISQSSRNKKSISFDSKPANSASFLKDVPVHNVGKFSDKYAQGTKTPAQQQNGMSNIVVQGLADIALSNRNNSGENSGLAGHTSHDQFASGHLAGNGSNKAMTNGKVVFGGKKQGRASAVGAISGR